MGGSKARLTGVCFLLGFGQWALAQDYVLTNQSRPTQTTPASKPNQTQQPKSVQSTPAQNQTDDGDELTAYGELVEQSPTLLQKTQRPPQAVGRHNEGRLINGSAIPFSGDGYFLHKNTQNFWGTSLLVEFIQWFSRTLNFLRPGRPWLEVADLSKKGGGKFEDNGHLSHQNGLDVDIGFPTHKSFAGENFPRFIEKNKVNPDMDLERFWLALKILGAQPEVVLVYVDSRVKSAMCSYARSVNEYSDQPRSMYFQALTKLRPWKGHNNHFHIRFQCPSTSPKCQMAIPIDEKRGNGCPAPPRKK